MALDDDLLARRFESQRPRLHAVAVRMLGSGGDADDAVQEAWLRLDRADAAAIENLDAWLVTVVSRICLGALAARRRHAEVPLEEGAAPLSDLDTGADPEGEALAADSVGLALMVLLDELSPAERVAFVLHDLFDVPFGQVAAILGRNGAAARQLASRARRRLAHAEAGAGTPRHRQATLVDAFLAAARQGEFDRLLGLLDPDVVLHADEAAAAIGMAAETRGAAPVAEFSRRARGAVPALVAGEPGAAWVQAGVLRVAYGFDTDDGLITAIWLIADPARLRALDVTPLA
jgi:RNA polymerase sigma factor (sigma-70 family)